LREQKEGKKNLSSREKKKKKKVFSVSAIRSRDPHRLMAVTRKEMASGGVVSSEGHKHSPFCFWSTVSVAAESQRKSENEAEERRETDRERNRAKGKEEGKKKTEPKKKKRKKKNHPQEWRVVQKATLRL
jgi:hypothetical protein